MKKAVLLFFCLLTLTTAWGEKKASAEKEHDPEVLAYYNKVIIYRFSPQVFPMADTLKAMAEKSKNFDIASAAIGFKLQYYFQFSNRDSVEYYVAQMKDYSRKHNCHKQYYWAWGQLVEYYSSQYYFKTAEKEMEALQKQALKEKSEYGTVTCYRSLSSLYRIQRNYNKSIEYSVRLIDYEEQNNILDYNMELEYYVLVKCLLKELRTDEAYDWLTRWSSNYKQEDSYHPMVRMVAELEYWIAKDNLVKARALIGQILRSSPKDNLSYYQVLAEVSFNQYRREYTTALMQIEEYEKLTGDTASFKSMIPDIMIHVPGREAEGFARKQRELRERDSINSQQTNAAIEEYAVMMDVDQLQNENSQLKRIASWHLVFQTCIFLIIIGILVYLWLRQRNRLKQRDEQYDILEKESTHFKKALSSVKVARDLILPKPIPQHDAFNLCIHQESAQHTQGNFSDYAVVNNHLCFIIGETKFEEFPAVITMYSTCCAFRAVASQTQSAKEIMNSLNLAANINSHPIPTIAACVGVIDLSNGMMQICNAGHKSPLLIRPNDNGTALAQPLQAPRNGELGSRNIQFEQLEVQLPEKSRLFLSTSGFDRNLTLSEKPSEDQIALCLMNEFNLPLKEQIDNLVHPILDRHKAPSQPLSEDITVIAIEMNHIANA